MVGLTVMKGGRGGGEKGEEGKGGRGEGRKGKENSNYNHTSIKKRFTIFLLPAKFH